MPQPNLLNATYIEIEQIDEDNTVYHDRRRNPANVVKRKTKFKIKAQIFFQDQDLIEAAKKDTNAQGLGGNVELAYGYIIVRKFDLSNISKTLKNGDKIVSYGNVGSEIACEYYLFNKKDAAQYADKGGTTLERWYFEDRN